MGVQRAGCCYSYFHKLLSFGLVPLHGLNSIHLKASWRETEAAGLGELLEPPAAEGGGGPHDAALLPSGTA